MKKRIRADEAFDRALRGDLPQAPRQLASLQKLVEALRPPEQGGPAPDPRFRARLRSELLAAAAHEATEQEELFAALLEGGQIEAPAEMRQLAKVATALGPEQLPVPDPSFRYQLRSKLIETAVPSRSLLLRAGDALVAWNARLRRNMRVMGAMGVALFLMLGSAASLAASRDALPGDLLYPVKRFQESAQLMGTSGAPRGMKLLEFARFRVGEVDALLDRGVQDATVYRDTLNDMDDLTVEGRNLILDHYQRTRETRPLRRLAAFAREQAADLAVMVDRLPPAARPVALDSLTLVDSIAKDSLIKLELACAVCPNGFAAGGNQPVIRDPNGLPIGCACETEGGTTTTPPSDSNPTGPDEDPADDPPVEPDPSEPSPPPTDDDGSVDLPSLPGDADEPVEDLIDDLIDPLESLAPTPLPSLSPSLPGL